MMTFNEIKQVETRSNIKVTIEKVFTRSDGNNDETYITFKITNPCNIDRDIEEYIHQAASSCSSDDKCPED